MARRVYDYPVSGKKGWCAWGPTGDDPAPPEYWWDTASGTVLVGTSVVVQPYGAVPATAVPMQPSAPPEASARRMSTLV